MELEESIDGLVGIGIYPTAIEAHERGLVVLSARFPYWLHEEDGQVILLVPESSADQLSYQIDLFEKESVNWPPPEPVIPDDQGNAWALLVWVTTLTIAYIAQVEWSWLFDWGILSSEAIRAGELYRIVTALFLHADIGHLVGNLLFGAVFVHFIARHTGTLLALLAVLASGAGGNLLNALIHVSEPHLSIGASTAVFGSIGILVTLRTGYVLRNFRKSLANIWALPFITGWIMLAWFGTGSEFTDTTAHLLGFACGLPLGVGLGMVRRA